VRVLIAGGAGFIGSHLCDALLARGDEVIAVDNFISSRPANIEHLTDHERFLLLEQDVTDPLLIDGQLDAVMDLASPASPADFATIPLEILAVGSTGTKNLLDLAVIKQARFFLASTSEVYGDPLVHPQTEEYWGNVNPIGPRGVYDEAKRFSASCASSTRTARACAPTTVESSAISSPRPCAASRSRCSATAARRVASATSTTKCAA